MLRFAGTPEVTRAVGSRIERMRRLVLDYAAQYQLAEADTGLVDISWTGRMVASLIHVCEAAGMSRPRILFRGTSRAAAELDGPYPGDVASLPCGGGC